MIITVIIVAAACILLAVHAFKDICFTKRSIEEDKELFRRLSLLGALVHRGDSSKETSQMRVLTSSLMDSYDECNALNREITAHSDDWWEAVLAIAVINILLTVAALLC